MTMSGATLSVGLWMFTSKVRASSPRPPASSTLPSASTVALCPALTADMGE